MINLNFLLLRATLLISSALMDTVKDLLDDFQQNDYKLTPEWAEVVRYNKRDFKQFDMATFKYNRTSTAFNLTFLSLVDIGYDLEVMIQGFKFASNEYRSFLAVNLQINFCHALAKNIGGYQSAYKCGNFAGCPFVKQSGYQVIFERMEIANYSTTYIGSAETHNFKYNRTNAMVNMSFLVLEDFVGKLDMEVQAYKMASNEYRFFPMRFSFNFCNYMTQNEFGLGGLYRCGNLTGCPFKKGKHFVCNWAVNGTKFPPNVPAGNYLLELKFIYREIDFLSFQLYASTKYPEVKGFQCFKGRPISIFEK